MAVWATLYGGWRERLLGALALLEAEIDFGDEGDVPDAMLARVLPEVERCCGPRSVRIWPTGGASGCGRVS